MKTPQVKNNTLVQHFMEDFSQTFVNSQKSEIGSHSFTIATTGSYTVTRQHHKLDSFHLGHVTSPCLIICTLAFKIIQYHFLN
jgi:hypothetical protein